MSRLDIKTQNRAQTVVDNLYRDVERRIAASPPGLCPVDMSLAFLKLCHAQSCGKCVPCRIGLGQLSLLIEQVVDGTATMETLAIIERRRAPLSIQPTAPSGAMPRGSSSTGWRASATTMSSTSVTTGVSPGWRSPSRA